MNPINRDTGSTDHADRPPVSPSSSATDSPSARAPDPPDPPSDAPPDPSPILVLASGSARRVELLQQLGFKPSVMPVDIDESPANGESATGLVQRLAREKVRACAASEKFRKLTNGHRHPVILGADTVVDLDGQILGKPEGQDHAIEQLLGLSDRSHYVHTGVCVQSADGSSRHAIVSTQVVFTELSAAIALRYWRSGEPEGKAGGYAIQGLGAQFVERLAGSYSNVVGLPLFETSQLLAKAGLSSL